MPLQPPQSSQTITAMPEREPPDKPAYQRRVLIRPRLYAAIEELAADRETDVAEEANRAVRELLEREGRWPPKSDDGATQEG